jgi:hypothetical protein
VTLTEAAGVIFVAENGDGLPSEDLNAGHGRQEVTVPVRVDFCVELPRPISPIVT